ncbi:hypothetical protein [Endozoicomonas sp. ALE010]|uniref:hypothetical protein n=1 Tax=Endozoicomonas sp. ALE010 TaxID=3403081 RepID=UPI003BB526A0
MPKFPALPASVDRYVREFLNRLAGRSGNAGDKAVLHSELAELGLAKEIGQRLSLPASAVGSITDTLKPVQPEITVPVEGDGDSGVTAPDAPTAATGLSTNGIFGAVILQWDAPAYNGHNHTEVWRAQTDDRAQASLVHEANGSRYTDVTGNTVLHYYWVRHVNSGGQVGSFNALAGTSGQGTAIINLADLMLESPELSEQPFTVRNVGTDEAPEYVLIFNGYLAVNGPVNISQLQSGELQNGTALTVGQGSIELSTGSDGFGQMVITGSGGIATDDYLVLKQGRIESYIYTASAGHVRYKEVRRTESGIGRNGQAVIVPAYFKSQPTINLYPRDITVYNADYPDQSQRLELYHTTPQPYGLIEGAWVFFPYARLLLADGSKTVANSKIYQGGNNDVQWFAYDTDQVKKVTVKGRVASSRSTGSGGTWQNRKATITLKYRPDNRDWIDGESVTVDIDQFTTHDLEISQTLTQGKYDVGVQFFAEDREGTFNSGEVTYDYKDEDWGGADWQKTLSPTNFAQTVRHSIAINNPALPGWEITKIQFYARVDIRLEVRNLYLHESTVWGSDIAKGRARVRIPDDVGGYNTYEKTTSDNLVYLYDDNAAWESVQFNDISMRWEDQIYKDGKVYPEVEVWAERAGYKGQSSAGSSFDPPYVPTSVAYVHIRSLVATVYYRRPQPVSNTPDNTFYWDTTAYDLGATDVSIADAIIHWTATGE